MESAKKSTGLDVLLAFVLMFLMGAFLLAAPSEEREWRASTGNALLGLNVLAWGGALALAYRFPQASWILRTLARVGKGIDHLGPLKLGHLFTLILATFLLVIGLVMFVTGAGWA